MIGGHELTTPGNPAERRLRNVVDEMAIATGLEIAPCLRARSRAGHQRAGGRLGAAGQRDRRHPRRAGPAHARELQGVVAHEFAHILNGDTRLNMRLIGMVFGLQMVSNLGRMMMEPGRQRPARTGRADRAGPGRGRQHRLAGGPLAEGRRLAPARVPGRRLCRAVHPRAHGHRRCAAQDRHPVAPRRAPAARQRRGGVASAAVVGHLAESRRAGDPPEHRGAAAPHLRPQHGPAARRRAGRDPRQAAGIAAAGFPGDTRRWR